MAKIHKKRPTIVKRQTTFHAKYPKKKTLFGAIMSGAKTTAKAAKYIGKGIGKSAVKTMEFIESDEFQRRVRVTEDFSRKGFGLNPRRR